jgi:hypothetical protein
MPLTGELPQNYVQTLEDTSRALLVGDAFVLLYSNNGALVFTVPEDIFSEGTQISLCDFDGGAPVFAAGAGVTLSSAGGLGPLAQFQVASIILTPTDNEWIVVGSV